MKITISLIKKAPVQDMIALYKDAGWWEEQFRDSHGFLSKLPKTSALFAGAFEGERMIGMGRALSDECSDAYIQDIAVLTPFRRKGIGRRIVQALIIGLRKQGVDWIGLISEPEAEKFYKSLGFRPMENHIPFKLEDDS